MILKGQPIGLIVAETDWAAKEASKLVKVTYSDLPAIHTIDEAIKNQSFYPTVHGLSHGNLVNKQLQPKIEFEI